MTLVWVRAIGRPRRSGADDVGDPAEAGGPPAMVGVPVSTTG
jgi:hypothetical protein